MATRARSIPAAAERAATRRSAVLQASAVRLDDARLLAIGRSQAGSRPETARTPVAGVKAMLSPLRRRKILAFEATRAVRPGDGDGPRPSEPAMGEADASSNVEAG